MERQPEPAAAPGTTLLRRAVGSKSFLLCFPGGRCWVSVPHLCVLPRWVLPWAASLSSCPPRQACIYCLLGAASASQKSRPGGCTSCCAHRALGIAWSSMGKRPPGSAGGSAAFFCSSAPCEVCERVCWWGGLVRRGTARACVSSIKGFASLSY